MAKLFENSDFWEKLKFYLSFNKISMKTMASILRINYQSLMTRKKRGQMPSEEDLQKIADFMRIPIEKIISNDWTPIIKYNRSIDNEEGKKELLNPNTGYLTIPFVSQKISAGFGEELLNTDDVETQTINLIEDFARGIPRESLLAARVKGDSMIDVYIYPDDIVVFAKGIISGDGIYVLSIDNEVMVKRLVFDRLEHSILIISENKKYPQREAKDDNQSLRILGKVVGWIHANSV